MSLKFYNTLKREKEEFEPITENEVKIYSCGQTIYDDLHIGNARAYSAWDVLNRYLTWKGYDVFHVLNITDVGHLTDDGDQGEDKVEKRAKEKKIHPRELVTEKIRELYDEFDRLNIKRHNINPRATGHINEMIDAIEKIIDSGYGYVRNGSVYFDVMKFQEDFGYPVISEMNLEQLLENASGRLSEKEKKEKKSPLDFALWIKADPNHIMKWNSPWSKGYPGWHIECSVMSSKYLGEKFDIHTGGEDHIFPHHPNERAQNYAMNNLEAEPVNYWLHSRFITVEGTKMSKSKGNFYTVKEVLEKYDGNVLRIFFAGTHYRKHVDFTMDKLENAKSRLERIENTYFRLKRSTGGNKENLSSVIEATLEKFEACMDDDMDTPGALNTIMEFVKEINKNFDNTETILGDAAKALHEMCSILGMVLDRTVKQNIETNKLIDTIIDVRQKLRENGDYELADHVRTRLKEHGILLEDSDEDTNWKYI